MRQIRVTEAVQEWGSAVIYFLEEVKKNANLRFQVEFDKASGIGIRNLLNQQRKTI